MDDRPKQADEIRRRAEAVALEKAAQSPENLEAMSAEGTRRTLHELRVHQIELEMQNEELRRAQQEIEASRVKYFDLYDMAPVGYFTVDEKGLILEANLRGADLLGVVRNRLVRQPISRHIVPEDQEIYYLHRRLLLETGVRQVGELRMRRRDGSPFWARMETVVARDGEDGPPVCRISVSDITEHKRAEENLRRTESLYAQETLRKSEERHQTILQTAMDGFWLVDTQGRLVEVNETYCRMSGYNAHELLAMRISDLESGGTADDAAARIQKIVALGEDRFESRHRRKDGSIFDVKVSVQYRANEGGRLVAFLQDITDRKRGEAERERLQEQLHQAMKMEAVGRLAGSVAHDFNNILTVIFGYSELLLKKVGKGSPLHGELEEIKKAGERAAALTQQLLSFSRKQIIEPKVVHLDRLVAEVKAMLTRLIGEDIAVQIITCNTLGAVKIDPGHFQQILMNLVVNARDAMPGGGKISIETANVVLDEGYCALHPYLTPGRFVMLSVSDTGVGMSEEVKAQIFEPFFTTKVRGNGTGLGLATTYGAVRQAGGSIEAQSEVGKGTTFRIYLPRVEEEETAEREDDAPPRDLPGGTETVLLVEDEDPVRNLCARILGDVGYKVMPARNGAEAVEVAVSRSDRIDLLLTDVVMPGMNGSELATQLVLHHPEMKVLFMSGYTDNAIVHHGVLDEGVSFIGKPHSPEGLLMKVREVLDKA